MHLSKFVPSARGGHDTLNRVTGTVFDDVAAEYDRHRPTYPDELVDEARTRAGLEPGDEVLEIGCGSGQLTRALVARGLNVTAVEPGKNLIALAAQKAKATYINTRFEDADLPSNTYRAAFSASAFHWIDPKVGWRKVADVLTSNGTLALLQYCGLEDPRTKPDQDAVLDILARVAPDIAAAWPAYRDMDTTLAGMEQRRDNVSNTWAWLGSYDVAREYAAGLFGDVQVTLIPMLLEHTPAELNAVFRTLSAYARLAPDQRDAIEREYQALYERLGRPIRSSTAAVLVTARLASQTDHRENEGHR
jgi:ubiquinone/menaquinone biosynthesis C-methylase UbiE